MDYGHTIDDWAEDTDDFCDACDDWSEDDGHGNCKSCGVAFKTVDPFLTPSVAKAYSSPAPTVSASGDLYGRGAGYTWGRGGSWWSSGVSAMTSMWGNNTLAESDKKVRMLKHKRHLDSLCKVVDPTVKHTLNYATDSSYSSINRGLIYVDGSLLEKDDDNLDIVAGLAIHEKLHLVHTKPLLKWESIYAQDNHLAGYQQGLLHNIGNIIEDEYIESQLAKTHAGFVSYIAKLKEHYFGKHGKKLEVEGNEFGEILNTLLAFVRYPSALSDDRKKKHGRHIQFFARALAPAYKSRENSLVAIQAIYEYMYQIAKDIAKKKGSDESVEELIDKKVSDRWDEIMDKWGGETALGDEEKTRMKDRLTEDIRADVEYDKRHLLRDLVHAGSKQMPSELADYTAGMDSISEHLDRTIKDLEDSDYSEEMWDKSKSLGLAKKTKVTWRNQRSNESSNYEYNDALSSMKSAIGQLKRRIQLFGNTNIHTIRNQRRGKLDKRMLHKIPLGRPDLFKNTIIDEDKPLDVCLLVDESGSMGTWKMKKARQTAIAIREALKDNQALNLWVFGHTADGYDWDAKGQTNMSCYWSPTHQTDIKAMGAMRARSENRDGVAILASAGRVQAESPSMGSNKLMIVISDGEPSADGYRYHQGVPHTKKAVSHLEGQGWSMIQIGISGARESAMREMFTNYVLVENMDNLSNTVSKVIRKVIKV